jgi:hypothetical protein
MLKTLETLLADKSTRSYGPVHPGDLSRLAASGVHLPPELVRWLTCSNGAELFDGYVRIFGVGQNASIDSVVWNDINCWKFAWGTSTLPYWCFAETAWGDQFAFELTDLSSNSNPTVFMLHWATMSLYDYVCPLNRFLEDRLILQTNLDWFDRQTRNKFPFVEVDMHLTFTPPLSMLPHGDEWDVAYVSKLNARATMICNGDIAMQEKLWPPGATPAGLETYEDDQGRTRLKILWKTE